MNPVGGLVIILGSLLILMGIFGTQRNVSQALKKSRPSASGATGGAIPQQPVARTAGTARRPAVIGITA